MSSTFSTQTELASSPRQASATASANVELLPMTGIEPPVNDEGFSLPSTDGGKDAWLCLLSCFLLEALIWGISFLASCKL